MQGKLTAELQKRVLENVVNEPPAKRMGLQDGDLYGAAADATAALRAGNAGEAFGAFAHLVMIDPTNPSYHAGLAEASLELGLHTLALQSASVVVACQPAMPDGYFLSARACLALGEAALALEDLAETQRWAQKVGNAGLLAAAQKMAALIGEGETGVK